MSPTPISTNICYLLTRLKSPLFYLIKSKSSDQDVRCSIYNKFLHFINIQGQMPNLITARLMASAVLKMSSGSFLSCNVNAKWSSRGAVFFNKVALYNFMSVRELRTTLLGIYPRPILRFWGRLFICHGNVEQKPMGVNFTLCPILLN